MTASTVLLAIASFAVSVGLVALVKNLLGQQLSDIPNERSSHTRPTPRGGGLGFILAFAIATIIYAALDRSSLALARSLWIVLLPLAIVGVIDDRGNVPAAARYLVQIATAGLALWQFGSFPQPWLDALGPTGTAIAYALTAIGFTAIVNLYNFMDGLDGLVAGTTAVQLGFIALVSGQSLWGLLVAALLGFLVWNWSPAKIFMGDAGSTVLGASVALALLNGPAELAWPLLAVTLPVTGDAIYTLFRRLLRGENIFQAHRTHIYQRLNRRGWPHARVASLYIALTALFALGISTLGAIAAWLALAAELLFLAGSERYLSAPPAKTSPEI